MSELIYTMRRDAPCTAEQFLRRDCGMSRRLLSHLKAIGGITVNGRILRSIDTVYPGDEIQGGDARELRHDRPSLQGAQAGDR